MKPFGRDYLASLCAVYPGWPQGNLEDVFVATLFVPFFSLSVGTGSFLMAKDV